MFRTEYAVRDCVWVLGVMGFCVEPEEKHRLRPYSTEGMCDFGREGETVQRPLCDFDVVYAAGIPIADQGRTEHQGDFRPSHMVVIASHRACDRPHDVNVVL